MRTHFELGNAIAAKLDYHRQASFDGIITWRPLTVGKMLKGQHMPRIESFHALTRLYGKTWYVDLYAWEDPDGMVPNVVGIAGDLDKADATMAMAKDAIPPALWGMYERKREWLKTNPMYQQAAVKSSESRSKVSPSQLTV